MDATEQEQERLRPAQGTVRPLTREPVVFNQYTHPKGLGRVALGGLVAGLIIGTHAALVVAGSLYNYTALVHWGTYMCLLMTYHFLEFAVTARFKPASVSFESFLFFHSNEYMIAVSLSWIEFWLEVLLVPSIKGFRALLWLGLAIAAVGQFFRTGGMWTAGSNFSHIIASTREAGHQLVTSGVYRYLRHPSYFGWFWWAVSTQVILGNPVCLVAYALVSWRFFAERIPYEERTLYAFFKEDYRAYHARTTIGIPFISTKPPGRS